MTIPTNSLVQRLDAVEVPGGGVVLTIVLDGQAKDRVAEIAAAVVAAIDDLRSEP